MAPEIRLGTSVAMLRVKTLLEFRRLSTVKVNRLPRLSL